MRAEKERAQSVSQVVIENPIINSPFDEPTRHFRFTDEGITNEEVERHKLTEENRFGHLDRP
jgi:hypothetical protein